MLGWHLGTSRVPRWPLCTSMDNLWFFFLRFDCVRKVYSEIFIQDLKVPLKIFYFFAWYLCRGVVLTTDNLAKRNWNGCEKCVFLSSKWIYSTSIFWLSHGDFLVWRAVFVTFNLLPPTRITNMLSHWFLTRKKFQIFLQVVLRAVHWIRTWSLLDQTNAKDSLEFGCNRLETVTQEFFNRFRWHASNRLGRLWSFLACYSCEM